ncbi:MAG: hypothetical protein KI786_04790 [Mameliella sp.]|nr:hypothetical protein [Phaeodactylibacter sp.]NRA51267.1 hypothetical protein [Phaeodactylibacter sp.]
MNKYYFFCLLLTTALFVGCSADQTTNNAGTDEAVASAPATTQAAVDTPNYPSVPADTILSLFNECDYIDYVFYYTNFSISQNQKNDIQTAITYIASEVPQVNPNCKPVGRIFYQVNGENRVEADLYFDQNCMYYLFYEDGKPAYANRIMPAGIDFYSKIFNNTQVQ